MSISWARFKAWLFPCACWCCAGGGTEAHAYATRRVEVDGTAVLWTPGVKGESPCRENHEAIYGPCAFCRAAA